MGLWLWSFFNCGWFVSLKCTFNAAKSLKIVFYSVLLSLFSCMRGAMCWSPRSSVYSCFFVFLFFFWCWDLLLFCLWWCVVFKFVEAPENNERQPLDQKSKDKFKIMSLKVKGGIDYVPELVSHIGPLAKYFCLAFLSIWCWWKLLL